MPKQGRCHGGKAFHVLSDVCRARFARTWADNESNILECSDSGEFFGSTFSRWYNVKFLSGPRSLTSSSLTPSTAERRPVLKQIWQRHPCIRRQRQAIRLPLQKNSCQPNHWTVLGWAMGGRGRGGAVFDEPLDRQHGKVMNELCEGSKENESKGLRLAGGLFVLSDNVGCVYLDVDTSDEMNATTTYESIAKTFKRYPEPTPMQRTSAVESKLDARQDRARREDR